MANSNYDAQEEKLQAEIAQRQKKIKEIRAKKAAENRKKENHIKYQLGGVIRKYLDRPLEDDDVQNLEKFLYGQEHRANGSGNPGHYFTDFMNDPKYRSRALCNQEYKDMPDIPAGNKGKSKKKNSDIPEGKKPNTDDSEA